MRFDRVGLRNFKCYADAELTLRPGVTVIYGVNGSGKTSLLEASFFALYGSKALDGTLENVISNDADEMCVELWFVHDGAEYHIERKVKRRGSGAQTTTCLLETPDGVIEGARDVRGHVAGLLRMDAEAFVNCAYVRQGEVNKLINASPSDRQDMIDDLLQLGKLEEYRERASSARVGVGRVRDDKQGALSQLQSQIEAKEAKDLHDRLGSLQTELTEVSADIENKEANRDAAQTTLNEAKSVLEEYEERSEEIDELEREISTLTDEIAAATGEQETLTERIRALRETTESVREQLEALLEETALDEIDEDAIDARRNELDRDADEIRSRIESHRLEAQSHAAEAETKRERAESLETQAEEARERASALEAEVETARDELEAKRERADELDERIEQLKCKFGDAPVARADVETHRAAVDDEVTEARERVASLRTELKNARETVDEAERLLEEGKCPKCGQPIEESPHVTDIEADRKRVEELRTDLESAETRVEELEAKRERAVDLVEMAAELSRREDARDNARTLIEQAESTIESKRERIAELRSEVEDDEAAAEAAREAAEDAAENADEARASIGELNQKKASIDERVDRLKRLSELLDDVTDNEREIEQLRERRENKAEQNDLRRERLADKRERKTSLEEAFDESALEDARKEKARAEDYLEQVEPYLEEKRERRDELQAAVGAVENELDELDALRTRRNELRALVDRLDSLYDEAYELQEAYDDLRVELRQRNVRKLESMLNETFQLVYQNDSYARIELDEEYELTVYQKDGAALDPEQLSGGERALFNLSLRCAIYRLLAEGIEGQAPTPPLILDEPTVFLDAGHVSKLVELIESMTANGVDQIVVVSHDEELAGAADELVSVQKDPTTNRSSVERSATVEALL